MSLALLCDQFSARDTAKTVRIITAETDTLAAHSNRSPENSRGTKMLNEYSPRAADGSAYLARALGVVGIELQQRSRWVTRCAIKGGSARTSIWPAQSYGCPQIGCNSD